MTKQKYQSTLFHAHRWGLENGSRNLGMDAGDPSLYFGATPEALLSILPRRFRLMNHECFRESTPAVCMGRSMSESLLL